MKSFLVGVLFFTTPLLAYAAGFAKQSIFLSTTAPVEGQTILIHASVFNAATTTFKGTLVMRDEASEIGSAPITLDAGGATDASVSWKPTAGTHTIVADLKDTNGVVIEEGSQAFTIAPASKPTSTLSVPANTPLFVAREVQPSDQIQQSITNFSPTIGQYSSPIFKAIDSGRAAAATQLRTAIDWSKAQTASSSSSVKSGVWHTVWNALVTAALYALTVALFGIGNVGVFYPVIAILFLYIMWRLWRRYRRRY